MEWTRQFGTPSFDDAVDVAVGPDGSVYVVGHTQGTLGDSKTSGPVGIDAFVRKYTAGGREVWTRQFGTPGTGLTFAFGVAVAADGSVYVVGSTTGVLGDASAGGVDAFVRKYDAAGNVVWTDQFGTSSTDRARGVTVAPNGRIYVVGETAGTLPFQTSSGGIDAFVRRYDPDGLPSTRQFGTSGDDIAHGVAVAGIDHVYIVGSTTGTFPGQTKVGTTDAFIRRFFDELDGVSWTQQFGTSGDDFARGAAVAADNGAYVVGDFGSDAFVRRHHENGAVTWSHQFGTVATDQAHDVAVAGDGSVYVAGRTGGVLGASSAGQFDAYARKYTSAGTVVWTRQFGTPQNDAAHGVAVAPNGSVYVTGTALGALAPGQVGDLFIRKYGFAPTVGLVDTTQGRWHLRNSLGQVTSFFFGNPGDIPFMGDWNCNGIQTPGLYRQSDGFVYLRNSNTQGVADITFFFGNPGDVPIVGDFNGDGCDTVSIYRPSNQTFYIINQLGEDGGGLGAAETSYVFGNPGDTPFTGDFNGNGITTVGLHRESTGFVYYRNTHTQGIADAEFFFGDPGDRFVAGDWNGDGIDSPAVFRPSNTTFFFRFTNTQGIADHQFVFGEPPFLPVAGRFGLG